MTVGVRCVVVIEFGFGCQAAFCGHHDAQRVNLLERVASLPLPP